MADQPTPEQRAAMRRRSFAAAKHLSETACHPTHCEVDRTDFCTCGLSTAVTDVCAMLNELGAEVDRLQACLSTRPIDDPTLDATDGAHPAWWRGHDAAAKGMRAALERARRERDEARAELAALRAAAQVGEGEVLVRARRVDRAERVGLDSVAIDYWDDRYGIRGGVFWFPRSAIVTIPPSAQEEEQAKPGEGGGRLVNAARSILACWSDFTSQETYGEHLFSGMDQEDYARWANAHHALRRELDAASVRPPSAQDATPAAGGKERG